MANFHKSFKKPPSDDPSASSEGVQCQYCSRTFKDNRCLWIHIRQLHREHAARRIRQLNRWYECPNCSWETVHLESSLVHIVTHHPDMQNYKIADLTKSGGMNNQMTNIRPMPTEQDEVQRAVDSITSENAEEDVPTKNQLLAVQIPVAPIPSLLNGVICCEICGEVFDTLEMVDEHKAASACAAADEHESHAEESDDSDVTEREPVSVSKRSRLESSESESLTEESDGEEMVSRTSAQTTHTPILKDTVAPSTFRTEKRRNVSDTASIASDANETGSPNTRLEEKKIRRNVSITPTVGFKLDDTLKNKVISAIESADDVPGDKIEMNSLPLILGIHTHAKDHPENLLIVWCKSLEEDVLTTTSLNAANTIICVEVMDHVSMTDHGKDIWNKSHRAVFYIMFVGKMTHWTAIAFGDQRPPEGLDGELFMNYQDVEAAFTQHAISRCMQLVNVMNIGTAGLFASLPKSFVQKTIEFNHHQ